MWLLPDVRNAELRWLGEKAASNEIEAAVDANLSAAIEQFSGLTATASGFAQQLREKGRPFWAEHLRDLPALLVAVSNDGPRAAAVLAAERGWSEGMVASGQAMLKAQEAAYHLDRATMAEHVADSCDAITRAARATAGGPSHALWSHHARMCEEAVTGQAQLARELADELADGADKVRAEAAAKRAERAARLTLRAVRRTRERLARAQVLAQRRPRPSRPPQPPVRSARQPRRPRPRTARRAVRLVAVASAGHGDEGPPSEPEPPSRRPSWARRRHP
jgi:hypothetical protein